VIRGRAERGLPRPADVVILDAVVGYRPTSDMRMTVSVILFIPERQREGDLYRSSNAVSPRPLSGAMLMGVVAVMFFCSVGDWRRSLRMLGCQWPVIPVFQEIRI
jgi:hypothetical protein